jgi:site-specific recombinase XerD
VRRRGSRKGSRPRKGDAERSPYVVLLARGRRNVDPVEAAQLTGHTLAVWDKHYARSFGKSQRDEARDLRHAFCSLLIAEGLSVVEIAQQAGHFPAMMFAA